MVEKLLREGLIKSLSSADKKYVLGDLYYEFAEQPAYIKEYRVSDLQIVAGCFEKAKEVSMKIFVDAFGNLLTREQIRYLISKMESDSLITKSGSGRWTNYYVDNKIDSNRNILEQFTELLSKI
ncbi:MAG: hypothetical protein LBR84_10785 [Tannerella sp.]|nr:hypothetical protein [Tannerella sp.]